MTTRKPKMPTKEPTASWGYENDLDEPIWTYSSMSRSGAISLAKTMMTKFNSTIIEKPFERDDGIWVFMFTNPLKSMKGHYNANTN